MNALRGKDVEVRVVAELRALAGNVPTMAELRRLVVAELGDCTPAELAGVVQRLRYQGKLAWERLELSPSMVAQAGGEKPPKQSAGAPPAAEGGGSGDRNSANAFNGSPSSGPDDDEDDPAGVNDVERRLNDEAVEGAPRDGPVPAKGAAAHGSDLLRHDQPALPVGRVEEPRPDPAGNQPKGVGIERQTDAARHASVPKVDALGGGLHPRQPEAAGFVPPKLLHQAGIHAAATRAAGKPPPAPAHEPEIARLVREEVSEQSARRYRARSTGTVRQPLELRKFGVRDMSLAEGVSSLLAEDPHDLVAAIHRKHPQLWRRILLLGRATGQRPAAALYAALEHGLDQLEAGMPEQKERAA